MQLKPVSYHSTQCETNSNVEPIEITNVARLHSNYKDVELYKLEINNTQTESLEMR